MKIALFGGTQGIGLQLLKLALEQGHTVQVLARTPGKITLNHPNLTVIQGDVLNETAVSQTLQGTNTVVVSLGTTANNPGQVVSEGTKLVINQMKQQGLTRLVVVTSLGVGESKDQVPFFFKILMKTFLKNVMADKEIQENLVKESQLAWTIVRPGGLTDKPAAGQYNVSTGRELPARMVSRADVAAFILQLLAQNQYLQQAVGIS